MNADGSGQRKLTRNAADDGLPAWSPDGRKIAFVSGSYGHVEIYDMNADGSGRRNLTRDWGLDGLPIWSPDGRKIAFESYRGGDPEIYVMNADGSGQRRLTHNPAWDFDLAWSPDGRKIAFVRGPRGGNLDVYVMNADGSGQAEADAQRDAHLRASSCLVARRAEDRLRTRSRRQRGDLRHEPRRQRAAKPDAEPAGVRILVCLVARAEEVAPTRRSTPRRASRSSDSPAEQNEQRRGRARCPRIESTTSAQSASWRPGCCSCWQCTSGSRRQRPARPRASSSRALQGAVSIHLWGPGLGPENPGGRGRFTISGAISDRGLFVDDRHGEPGRGVRILFGWKGAIRITVGHFGFWRITKGTGAYAGLRGRGTGGNLSHGNQGPVDIWMEGTVSQ